MVADVLATSATDPHLLTGTFEKLVVLLVLAYFASSLEFLGFTGLYTFANQPNQKQICVWGFCAGFKMQSC